MKLFTREDVKTLLKTQGENAVSIFLPTEEKGAKTLKGRIELKNLLREAEEKLANRGLDGAEIKKRLKPAENLLEDRQFWQNQRKGLAIFISADDFRYYRLPLELTELVVVADRFHIKPLLPLLNGDGRFYILALSQNEIRLFDCTRTSCHQVELKDMPLSLDEALKYDDPEKSLQYSTKTPTGGQRQTAIYHGHGGSNEDSKENIQRFFRQIDKGLQKILSEEKTPLVLAGVDYLFPIYKDVNSYPHLLEEGISGNPEPKDSDTLQKEAWEIIEPYLHQSQEDDTERFYQLIGTGKASASLKEILPAAYGGRIDVLFTVLGEQRWGQYDMKTNQVKFDEESTLQNQDLLDFAALHTVINGGTVYAVAEEQVPGEKSVAAVYRY